MTAKRCPGCNLDDKTELLPASPFTFPESAGTTKPAWWCRRCCDFLDRVEPGSYTPPAAWTPPVKRQKAAEPVIAGAVAPHDSAPKKKRARAGKVPVDAFADIPAETPTPALPPVALPSGEVLWRRCELSTILVVPSLTRTLSKKGITTVGELADAGGPIVVLGRDHKQALALEQCLADWFLMHCEMPVPWAVPVVPTPIAEPVPPPPANLLCWGDDCTWSFRWTEHLIGVQWVPRLGGTSGGLLTYRSSVIPATRPGEEPGVWRLEVDLYAQHQTLREFVERTFAEEMARRLAPLEEATARARAAQANVASWAHDCTFETMWDDKPVKTMWIRHRQELVYQDERFQRTQAYVAGHWIHAVPLNEQQGDLRGYAQTRLSLEVIERARPKETAKPTRHRKPKAEKPPLDPATGHRVGCTFHEDLAEAVRQEARSIVTRATYLIDLPPFQGLKDVSTLGAALENGGIPTVGALLDQIDSNGSRRLWPGSPVKCATGLLTCMNGVGSKYAGLIVEAIASAGLLTEASPAPIYGYRIEYACGGGKPNGECHYAGTEVQARRKAMLRPHATEILVCEGLTEEQYVRVYGRGKS